MGFKGSVFGYPLFSLACALLLRARVFRGRAQRLWLMIPGYGALIWLAVTLAGSATTAGLPAVAPVEREPENTRWTLMS